MLCAEFYCAILNWIEYIEHGWGAARERDEEVEWFRTHITSEWHHCWQANVATWLLLQLNLNLWHALFVVVFISFSIAIAHTHTHSHYPGRSLLLFSCSYHRRMVFFLSFHLNLCVFILKSYSNCWTVGSAHVCVLVFVCVLNCWLLWLVWNVILRRVYLPMLESYIHTLKLEIKKKKE